MRYLNPTAAALVALAMFAPSAMFGQAEPPGLSVVNYQLVSEMRLTRTQWFSTYSATLANTGGPLLGVTATVTSLAPSVQVTPGQGTLHFKPVPANSQVPSSDTFTILVDRNVPFDFASLKWSFLNPVANAGPNQTAPVGSTITLNGSGSSNPSGVGTLAYSWSLAGRPVGSSATLSNAGSVMPSFTIDVPGNYVVTLTVNNGPKSDTATMTVSTVNSPAVARAGPNQTTTVGSTVVLNGSGSSDVDGDPLTYFWTLASRPAGSLAVIANFRSVSATFVADKPGAYVIQLVVNDGKVDSVPSTVLITSGSTGNTSPVANAGPAQALSVGALVQLNGSGSTDVDGDVLTYTWSLATIPAGSTAHLNNPNLVNPSFTADLSGTYVAQLIVNDGKVDSSPSMVTITTNALSSPTANAGPNQTVVHGATVTLSGSGSDPQGAPLTMAWSLITKPVGSTAVLSGSTTTHPTFVADRPGVYVAQLIVNNGSLNSSPGTVTVTTTNTPPVANAGPNQSVSPTATIILDGSASSDADHDALTYLWSFTSRPPGSSAALLAATTTSPAFVADAVGTYVAQLIVSDGFTNSNPATVTITVNALQSISFSPANLTLTGTETRNLTLTLSGPAPAGGLVFNITSSNAGAATVAPPTIAIPENTTTATVSVTGVAAGSAVIHATNATVLEATAIITVNAAADIILPAQLTVAPGSSIQFPISLASPAPSALYVQLTSTDPAVATVSLPGVNFNAGETQPTRQPLINGIARGIVGITATTNGLAPATSQVTVGINVAMSPASLTIGGSGDGTLTLTLSGVTPGNITFALSSINPGVATVPQVARILAGSTSISFKVTGLTPGSTVIKASALGFPDVTANVTVASPGTITLSSSTAMLQLGQTATITVTLSQPAASATTVSLTSSDTSRATISPSTVLIPQGGTTGSAQVTAVNVGSTSIGATAQGYTPAALVQQVGATIAWVNPSVTIAGNGQQAILDLRLFATVPGDNTFSILDGLRIDVTSSNPAVATTPSRVNFFWDGSSVPTVRVQVHSVSPGTTILHASGTNIPDVTMTVTVTGPAISETPAPAFITAAGGSPQSAAVNAAFAGTLKVLVKDSNNNPVSGAGVTFAAPASGASAAFAGGVSTAISDINGIATSAPLIANGTAGPYVITASLGPLSTFFALTNTAVHVVQDLDVPAPVSVVPASGAALSQPFTFTFRHPGGADKLSVLNVLINNFLDGRQSCYLAYVPSSPTAGTLLLVDNAGAAGGPFSSLALPGGGSISNSQCTISGAGSSVTADGDTLTLTLAATFSPDFAGNKVVYMAARDSLSKNSGWQALGVWEIPGQAHTGPAVVGVNPARTNNAVTQPYTFTFGDSFGYQDLTVLNILINTFLDGRTACYIAYVPSGATSGTVYLVGDAGNSSGPFQALPIPSSGVIQNGQCAIDGQGSSASGGGTTLSLTLAMRFADGFAGNQVIYAAARSDRANTDWQAKGTVTVLGMPWSNHGSMTASFTPQSLTLNGGETRNLTLTLSGPAPAAGVTLNFLSTNTGVATVSPATFTIPANATSATVQVKGVIAGAAVIRATNASVGAVNLSDASASITVQASSADIILPGPMTLRPGEIREFPVSLSAPAGPNGVFVVLTSDDPSKVSMTPSNGATVILFFPPGSTLPDRRTPSVYGITYGSAIITATAEGFQSNSQTVQVASTLSFSPQSVTLNGASTQNLTLTLSGAAPPAGITFNITSNNPGVAAVGSPTVTIAGGATTATVRVTGISGGSAVITASAVGISLTATAGITVNAAAADIILPGPLTLQPGQVADFPFSLSAPAGPGGAFIVLTSSDPTKVALTPTGGNSIIVFVPAGSTLPDRRPPSVYGINFGSATITATGDGSGSFSQVIQVTATLSFGQSNFTINFNGRENRITLSMSAPAPAGGVTINMSSENPSVANVPATIFIPSGATSQTVALTSVAIGSTTIHASALPNIPDAAAGVTVVP